MTNPVLTLQAFAIGYILIIFIARLGVELYLHYHDKQARKTLKRPASANKAIQNYYNTYRKGA